MTNVGSVLVVDLLTPPQELLESPTVRRLSNNFRGAPPPKKKVAGKSILVGQGSVFSTEATPAHSCYSNRQLFRPPSYF